MANKRILVISDMHLPYQHKDSIIFLKEIKKEYKPDMVVNIGDLLDFHAISMHEHNPDLYSVGHELDKAKAWLLSNKSHKKDLKKFCYNWISKATPTFTPRNKSPEQVRDARKAFDSERKYKESYGNEEIAETEDISEIFKNFKLGDMDD